MARPPAGAEEGGGLGFFGFGFIEQPKRRPHKRDKAPGGAPDSTGGKRKATHDDTCNNCGRTGHWAKDCRQAKRGGQAHVAQAQEGD